MILPLFLRCWTGRTDLFSNGGAVLIGLPGGDLRLATTILVGLTSLLKVTISATPLASLLEAIVLHHSFN